VTERDGRERAMRLVYAGHNDHGYRSVGRWLVDRGELRSEEASWPAIRDWARRYPERVNEMLWSNPRVVFFTEEPLLDESIGPRGAQGVSLTPGRSVAVDPLALPYGSVLWLDSTEPLTATPLRRAVMAQDTGSAITGAVRIDYFWGWGAVAEQQAGRMKQSLRLWALWPRPG
jgi:membrane-bound lytic murein transglycosylase A